MASSFDDFQKNSRYQNGLEGFVVRFEDGTMVKVKTWWYYNLARGLSVESNINSEKYLWKTILENKYDDVRQWL